MNQTLLIELLTEELPPKALVKLGDAFAAAIVNGLKARDFLDEGSTATSYATPRRLAVSITRVRATSPDKSIRDKVLPVSVALDASGNPTAPLAKKLAAMGFADVTVDRLERAVDGKAESFFYTHTAQGSALETGLQAALAEALGKLPIPKLMSYQRPDGDTVQFVRPAHKLVALHGDKVVPLTALGLGSGNVTLGHRFLSHGRTITIAHAEHYEATLETEGRVIASPAARKDRIRTALLEKAGADKVLMPDSLLDEVGALVEWPVVYECRFEEEFLAVPQECLILTMQTNQKYFALTDAAGKLRSRFLIVSNIATESPQHIIGGNERVVRPRLADAKFFFDQDRKKTLESRVAGLDKVVYHNKLGTQGERVERVRAIAKAIGQQLGGEVLAVQADTAARLSKTDLLTDMVGEFPELQGIMGGYYARHDGLGDDIALAIEDHYKPRFAGDALPRNTAGVVVALAEKLETLVGMFGIGNLPTGDKDPFALRRHALGVIRMLVEKDLPLDVNWMIDSAQRVFGEVWIQIGSNGQVGRMPSSEWNLLPLVDFIYDRLAGSLREQGYSAQEVDAVLALRPQRLSDVDQRLAAVRAFAALPEAPALAAANKRISNILKKAQDVDPHVSEVLLKEPAEIALHAAMKEVAPKAKAQFDAGDYTASLQTLAALRAPVDAFFDGVMVNADEIDLRLNRQGLLKSLHEAMNRVADLSRLTT